MKRPVAVLVCLFALSAYSHFQVVLPPTEILSAPRTVDIKLFFTHPMDNGPLMTMGAPKRFGVLVGGKKVDLLASLNETVIKGKRTYSSTYRVKKPGDYLFYLEPAPYWEPIEQKMIIHYTKVCVSSMQTGDGWDSMIGFPVEIVPLACPYGLYTGNCFRGMVMQNGKPVPFATIEVEYLNDKELYKAPTPEFTTQVIKSDANGVFTYSMPVAGWWGFAALVDGSEKLANPDGKLVDVELGGLMWVRCRDIIKK